jgi:hypothetical protein
MTFVSPDGVEQSVDIYVIDQIEAIELFADKPARAGIYMGWHALHRQGLEERSWDEWFASLRKMPDIDMEEDDPKE